MTTSCAQPDHLGQLVALATALIATYGATRARYNSRLIAAARRDDGR